MSDTVTEEIGATNFMTGAGGFLQLIFNGFVGVRVHLKHLEIKNPRLPENLTVFRTRGFSYLNSKFQLEILNHETILTFYRLADELNIQLEGQQWAVVENTPCTVQKLLKLSLNSFCFLPPTDSIPANSSCIVKPTTDVFGKCDIKSG